MYKHINSEVVHGLSHKIFQESHIAIRYLRTSKFRNLLAVAHSVQEFLYGYTLDANFSHFKNNCNNRKIFQVLLIFLTLSSSYVQNSV